MSLETLRGLVPYGLICERDFLHRSSESIERSYMRWRQRLACCETLFVANGHGGPSAISVTRLSRLNYLYLRDGVRHP